MVARIGAIITSLIVLGVVSIVLTLGWYGRAADDVDLRPLLDYRPPQVTRVLARDGTPIGEIALERRSVVGWDALPRDLVDAFVAAEDADFFEHAGLDWSAIAGATLDALVHGEARRGASTITQQVIKNTLLGPARTIERKSMELMLVERVEALLDKHEIFTIYVNAIYLGEGCHGVEQAARHYFGKSVGELDLGEAALLAALPRAPGRVTPYRNPERLEARRKRVLVRMIRLGMVEADEAAPFLATPPAVLERDDPRDRAAFGEADEFVELTRRELIRRYGEARLATLGATVRTSVDLEIQRAARAGARVELDEHERRHGRGRHARALSDKARARLFARAPARLEVGESHGVVVTSHAQIHAGWLTTALADHRVRVRLPSDVIEDASERFPIGGALRVRITAAGPELEAALEPGPELALALADVRSGELRALIGGRDFVRGDFDRSVAARRQPGSAFKPVLHGAALQTGRFTAASRGRGGLSGEPMRLREALAQSDNAVARALFEAIGPAHVHAFARALGMTSPLASDASLALGASEVTPLELLTAYLALARGGEGIDPIGVLEIEVPRDLAGELPPRIDELAPPRHFGIDVELAALLTSMLRSAVDEGGASRAAELGRPVAGKTGTTDEARDAWFAGYTHDHVAVAWVGFDLPHSLGTREGGGELALPIWLAAMRVAERGLPSHEFDVPPELARIRIDRETGELACRPREGWFECSDPERWITELFVPGTTPDPTPFGTARLGPDPDERGAPPPRASEVALVHARVFVDDPEPIEATSLGLPLAARRRAIEASWRIRVDAEPEPWRADSRVRARVVLDPRGALELVTIVAASGDPRLDALALAALREGLREGGPALPELLFDPRERLAELEFDLRVGDPPQDRP
ncbi:transglycosylase domain-containing protein [Nannocystaceae bacterium ST9]